MGIKTRKVVKGTIKQLDRASVAAERMRSTYVMTKDRAEHSVNAAEGSPDEYAANRYEEAAERATGDAACRLDKRGRKSIRETGKNYSRAKDALRNFREKHAQRALRRQGSGLSSHTHGADSSVKQGGQVVRAATGKAGQAPRATTHIVERAVQTQRRTTQTTKTIKQSAKSTGKKTIKTVKRKTAGNFRRTVKTAERTSKVAVKTPKQAAKAVQQTANTARQTARATARAAQKAAQAAKLTVKASAIGIKVTAKAAIASVKAIIAGIKGLAALIAAGGWIALVIIVLLCAVGLACSSVFGIFFSGESPDGKSGMSMPAVVKEINTDYENLLNGIRNATTYDTLQMSGARAVWKEVLAVYAVKVNTDPNNPQEVSTIDEHKKQLLKDIFWDMNEISHRTETKTETVIKETDDGNGNILEEEVQETRTILYITVSHKTADEIATAYGFNEEQNKQLEELLAQDSSMWAAVLYGIYGAEDQIVSIALSQVGNVGGEPYWSWYGFNSRVEWCATFVSWCGARCGYIDTGVMPKFAGCVNGVQWFRNRGQWADNSVEPTPGMIIFFDWDNKGGSGPQDGLADHVGLVEKVENGIVYTVEGNSGDCCVQKTYPLGHYEIFGYGQIKP